MAMIFLRRSMFLSILGFFIQSFSGRLRAQDRAAVVPEMKVLLENEHVRVQYHDVNVGEKTPFHSHPAYVAYVITPYKARLVTATGSATIVERKPGDVF